MTTIRRPIYIGYASNRDELDNVIRETKKKYQQSYPNSIIEINIEPEPNTMEFDGSIREFNYQAIIEYKK